MENGTRSFHAGEFAYDEDNDAWAPMGDSPGTTPVWWGCDEYGSAGCEQNDLSLSSDRRFWPPIVAKNWTSPEQEDLKLRLSKEKEILADYKRALEECALPSDVGFFQRRAARNRRAEVELKVRKQSLVVNELQEKLSIASDYGGRQPLRIDQILIWDDVDSYVGEDYYIYYAELGNGVIWIPVPGDLGHSYVGWALTVNRRVIEVSDAFVDLRRWKINDKSDLLPLVEHFNANSKYVQRHK